MATQKEIDELVKMLDGRMSSGSGHVNVKVNENGRSHCCVKDGL